jgi:hypothetical protein
VLEVGRPDETTHYLPAEVVSGIPTEIKMMPRVRE